MAEQLEIIQQIIQPILDALWGFVKSSFFIGFLSSLSAGVLFAYLAKRFKSRIKKWFLPPTLLHVRAPLMLASAPLFVSKTLSSWEERDLDVDLDFRYAGANALQDLHDNRCQFAVASEVALASFLSDTKKVPYSVRVMPFAQIEDHLKFVVPEKSHIETVDGLKEGGRIAYLKDSVHNDFLRMCDLAQAELKDKRNVMECYYAMVGGNPEVDACVLWEPHYRAFNNRYGMRLLSDKVSYTWFLCLVAKDEFVNENPHIVRNILGVMRAVTERCEEDHDAVINACLAYLHTEFTGVGKDELRELLNKGKHHFAIDSNVVSYRNKLEVLMKSYPGAGRLWEPISLWPGLKDDRRDAQVW